MCMLFSFGKSMASQFEGFPGGEKTSGYFAADAAADRCRSIERYPVFRDGHGTDQAGQAG